MAATTDIRLDRIKHEYQGVSKTQDALMDRVDTYEEALLGLTEAVAANHDQIMANHELIMANRAMIMANHESNERQFAEIRAMLEAIIKDQNVPYEKPAMGFRPQ